MSERSRLPCIPVKVILLKPANRPKLFALNFCGFAGSAVTELVVKCVPSGTQRIAFVPAGSDTSCSTLTFIVSLATYEKVPLIVKAELLVAYTLLLSIC
ncbi:hypothetical protein D3C85_1340570 [compost metagenome]